MLLLSGNNLVKPDRMGMAVSLEARTPFLDYRMMELAFRMPGNLKLRDGETKYLYKKAVRGLIGDELAYRKKQMFTVPVGEWFRDTLAPFTEAVLLDAHTIARGLFRENVVRDMLTAHQHGDANHTREIRALIAVELWSRIFLDNDFQGMPALEQLGIAPTLVAVTGKSG
jgi:asparagine synthase (glutamine-hydrolysing)